MTATSSIKTIIFDLGNVLVDFDHRIAAQKILNYTFKSPEDIYNLFFDSQITADFEKGDIGPKDFYLEVRRMLSLNLDYEKFVPIWNDIFFFSSKNLEVYNLARSLRENYKVAVLSNINILHFDYIKKTFPIFDAFHNVLASCDLHLMKPDPLIYRKALEILNCAPEETFYTDDRSELVESAEALRIQGFVFTGVDALRKKLSDLKIE